MKIKFNFSKKGNRFIDLGIYYNDGWLILSLFFVQIIFKLFLKSDASTTDELFYRL